MFLESRGRDELDPKVCLRRAWNVLIEDESITLEQTSFHVSSRD